MLFTYPLSDVIVDIDFGWGWKTIKIADMQINSGELRFKLKSIYRFDNGLSVKECFKFVRHPITMRLKSKNGEVLDQFNNVKLKEVRSGFEDDIFTETYTTTYHNH